MRNFGPLSAIAIVLGLAGLMLAADTITSDRWRQHRYQRVRPDPEGLLRLDVGDLLRLEVRFYRFLNAGNQEVRFLVGRDEHGEIQVGFDAGNSHYKVGRGFSFRDGWIVDNKCETTTRLSEVNQGGSGCKPTPLKHRVIGDQLVLRESDILEGWRYFR